MSVTELYIAIAVGLVIGLLVEEKIGVICGGVIVPGYLSLICDDLVYLLIVLLVAVIDYLVVEYVLSHFVILYGKRRFIACLLAGFVIKLALDQLIPIMPITIAEFRGIGIVVPGLIANTSAKQGFHITLPAVVIATYVTFGVVQLLLMIF